MKKYIIALVSFAVVLITACNTNHSTNTGQKTEVSSADQHDEMMTPAKGSETKKGQIVSNSEVCMVNDKFMGKPQLEVVVNGKSYYGCCEMCKNRIPEEQEVRVAVDPISSKEIDKASAVIAVTGDDGEVSYFENKQNFETFLQSIK